MGPDEPVGLQMVSLATLPVEIPTAGRSCRASVSFYCGSLERITAELKVAIRPGPQASLESTDGGSQTRPDPLPHSTQARAGWIELLSSFFPANPTRLRGHFALRSPQLRSVSGTALKHAKSGRGHGGPGSHTSQQGQGLSAPGLLRCFGASGTTETLPFGEETGSPAAR